ncbi:recombinase family protein [Salibacterium halotolerans]|uniref:Site-specific DNA recombinase n=1 Tax=Salibacterium halotolerans TaxID=1884432 RepID=A0A1I5MJX4_9BACI|nr:recombinase family protein [Salibacterium halotolerans]SFP09246.1 site-specific DNA recombinase [Salibacterium halotolerans]
MTAALYVRVSTEEQAKTGFSVDNQQERLIAFCKSQGWDDYKLYVDDGYSGTDTNRPALKRMINHVEEQKIDSVIVYKLDRLSRSQQDVIRLLEDVFETNNCAFKSATEPFDTDSPFGKAMIGILAVFAQLERDTMIERLTTGQRNRASKGYWHGGPIPFGYNWNKEEQQLEVNEEQADIVRTMFDMYLKGASRLEVSEWAQNRTAERNLSNHHSVAHILTRVLYTGKVKHNDQVIEGRHKAIVDDETYNAVQRELEKRKTTKYHKGKYLLTGLLKCGLCGCGITHVRRKGSKDVYYFYVCKDQHVRRKERKVAKCKLGYYRRYDIEDKVLQKIRSVSFDRKVIEKELNELETNLEDNEMLQRELQDKLSQIESKLDNLYEAIETGEIKASFVSDRINKLESERERVEVHLDDLKINKPKKNSSEKTIQLMENINETWDYLDFDEKREMLRKVIKTVIILPGGDVQVQWNLEE